MKIPRNLPIMPDAIRPSKCINFYSYFDCLVDHLPRLCQGDPPLYVPDKFLISEDKAYFSRSSIEISKATGPDNIPNRLLK